jgi:hypothetical protein
LRAYRLIGYENRLLGAGHSVTALYELVPPDSDQAIPEVDPLKYQTATVPTLPDTASPAGGGARRLGKKDFAGGGISAVLAPAGPLRSL